MWSVSAMTSLAHFGRRLDIPQGAHRAAAAGGPVHATGIQFHHAVLIGKPAIAHTGVARVQFHDVDAGDDGIQRVAAGLENSIALAQQLAAIAVGAGDDHGLGRVRPRSAENGNAAAPRWRPAG